MKTVCVIGLTRRVVPLSLAFFVALNQVRGR